mmetsp:Transcript_27859/g.26901  ORF Transcript_27859/g.26901 Transcript_27859/m.26901 type:complete len:121 (+) Transcript_27859:614-976(+)
METKLDEELQLLISKYGIKPKERYGDHIVQVNFKELLKKITEKHYKRTKLKDTKSSVAELDKVFSSQMQKKRSLDVGANSTSIQSLFSLTSNNKTLKKEIRNESNTIFHKKLLNEAHTLG